MLWPRNEPNKESLTAMTSRQQRKRVESINYFTNQGPDEATRIQGNRRNYPFIRNEVEIALKGALHEEKMVNRGLPSHEVLSGQYFQNGTFYANQGIATRPPSSRRRLKVRNLFMAHRSYLWHPANSKKSRQVPMDKGSSGRAASDRPYGPQTRFTQDMGL